MVLQPCRLPTPSRRCSWITRRRSYTLTGAMLRPAGWIRWASAQPKPGSLRTHSRTQLCPFLIALSTTLVSMRRVWFSMLMEGQWLFCPIHHDGASNDCSFWTSDEYGPYIYRFDSTGHLIQTIQPPAAILPEDKNGNVNFTSVTDPTTGRQGNQGKCSSCSRCQALRLHSKYQVSRV
jgi:hypothetical protein